MKNKDVAFAIYSAYLSSYWGKDGAGWVEWMSESRSFSTEREALDFIKFQGWKNSTFADEYMSAYVCFRLS